MRPYFPHYNAHNSRIFTRVMFTLNESTITHMVRDNKTKKIMEKVVKYDDDMKESLDCFLNAVNEFSISSLQVNELIE